MGALGRRPSRPAGAPAEAAIPIVWRGGTGARGGGGIPPPPRPGGRRGWRRAAPGGQRSPAPTRKADLRPAEVQVRTQSSTPSSPPGPRSRPAVRAAPGRPATAWVLLGL